MSESYTNWPHNWPDKLWAGMRGQEDVLNWPEWWKQARAASELAADEMLLEIRPPPDAPLTAEHLALGLQYLADLILCSEAADATLDLLKRDPRYAVDKAFAHYLEVFKTQGFNPLETVEVQAMGMGSPARFQLRVPTWRQTLVAAADRKST